MNTGLLRRRRQRLRLLRIRIQISDDVSPLAVLLDTGKAHRRTRNEPLGVCDELVQVVECPGPALGLHGCREIKPAAALAARFADNAIEVGADSVGTTLLKGMAGSALLGSSGALFDRSGLQQLLNR